MFDHWQATIVWKEYLESESSDASVTEGARLNPVDHDIWRILFGRTFTIHSNWSKGRGYLHICRGHSGTVTCLALPDKKSDNSNPKSQSNYLFSGSDDGSILLWNLNPPSQKCHPIHGKRKSNYQRNGCITQSPPIPPHSSPNDAEISDIPLLPPPILPLAQLVEGRKSGKSQR